MCGPTIRMRLLWLGTAFTCAMDLAHCLEQATAEHYDERRCLEVFSSSALHSATYVRPRMHAELHVCTCKSMSVCTRAASGSSLRSIIMPGSMPGEEPMTYLALHLVV